MHSKTMTVVLCTFVSVIVVIAIGSLLQHASKSHGPEPIQIEAVAPTTVHPISEEFSTGYILVEIWTKTKIPGAEVDVPHIVRMKRSEYIEFMNQPPDGVTR